MRLPDLCKVSDSHAQRTILVVDDQESVRKSLEHLLGLAGYKVIGAESGREAIALAAAEPVDGALIDVHMPVMNGFDTCLGLQDQAHMLGRELRVWFMTGALTRDVGRRCADLGALEVFAKPFAYTAFLARLEHGFLSVLPPRPPTTMPAGESASTNTPP